MSPNELGESDAPDTWERLIRAAVTSLDPRELHIVVKDSEEDPAPHRPGVPRPSLWSAVNAPLVVASGGEDQFVEALREAMVRGPVLTEFGFQRLSSHSRHDENKIVADLISATCQSQGVLAVVIPASLVGSDRIARLRSELTSSLNLRHVVFASGVLDGVSRNFEVACLIFSGSSKAGDDVSFFRMAAAGEDVSLVFDDQSLLLAKSQISTRFGYWAKISHGSPESLAFDYRNPELRDKRSHLANLGHMRTVASLFEVLKPPPPPARSRRSAPAEPRPADDEPRRVEDSYADPSEPGVLRELSGRDLVADGVKKADEESRYRKPTDNDVIITAGDVIVRSILPAASRSSSGLVLATYSGQEPCIAGAHILILRPQGPTQTGETLLATLFMRSPVCVRILTAKRGGATVMNMLLARDLAELEIPMPDTSTADAIVEIVDVRESLREWLLDADDVLDSLYKTENAVAAKQDVLDVSRTLRARVQLGHALDDPYERYRTTYPFPLAVGWRKVEAAFSGPDPESALREVLDAAEVTMAYAACVALLFARSQGLELGCVKEIRKKLGTERSGMGFGDWVNILNEATLSKQAKRVPNTAPLTEVRQFFDTPGVTQGRARLKKLRDAFAHGRRITGSELDEALHESFQDLSMLMEAAAPLSDLGFVLIDQAKVDSIRGTTALRYREFRGDHPVVPYRETNVNGTQFEEGSLYLRDTDGGWHLMRPYLLSNPCPTCHAWSVFVFDRVVNSVPDYKSLDHGHWESRPDCLDALVHVELLDIDAEKP